MQRMLKLLKTDYRTSIKKSTNDLTAGGYSSKVLKTFQYKLMKIMDMCVFVSLLYENKFLLEILKQCRLVEGQKTFKSEEGSL